MMKQFAISLCFMIGTIFFTADAWAYLDPGAGSALLQGVLGGVAAIGVVLKLYWHRILKLLGMRKAKPAESESEIDSLSIDKSNIK